MRVAILGTEGLAVLSVGDKKTDRAQVHAFKTFTPTSLEWDDYGHLCVLGRRESKLTDTVFTFDENMNIKNVYLTGGMRTRRLRWLNGNLVAPGKDGIWGIYGSSWLPLSNELEYLDVMQVGSVITVLTQSAVLEYDAGDMFSPVRRRALDPSAPMVCLLEMNGEALAVGTDGSLRSLNPNQPCAAVMGEPETGKLIRHVSVSATYDRMVCVLESSRCVILARAVGAGKIVSTPLITDERAAQIGIGVPIEAHFADVRQAGRGDHLAWNTARVAHGAPVMKLDAVSKEKVTNGGKVS